MMIDQFNQILTRYAVILFKKQLYVSKQQKVILKTPEQLAEDFWR